MSLFQGVRIFSRVESAVFAALLVVWLGHIDRTAEFVLGLTHGIGVLILYGLIYFGCLRRVFPWPFLGAIVILSPLGPFGSSVGIELMHRRGVGRPAGQEVATGR